MSPPFFRVTSEKQSNIFSQLLFYFYFCSNLVFGLVFFTEIEYNPFRNLKD